MAIKHQTTNITVVKHQGTTLATVYHGNTKVFPDQAYQNLNTYLYIDDDNSDYVMCEFYNPNSFSVSIYVEVYGETSSGDVSGSDSITVSANSGGSTTHMADSQAEYYGIDADYEISGGGYSGNQSDSG